MHCLRANNLAFGVGDGTGGKIRPRARAEWAIRADGQIKDQPVTVKEPSEPPLRAKIAKMVTDTGGFGSKLQRQEPESPTPGSKVRSAAKTTPAKPTRVIESPRSLKADPACSVRVRGRRGPGELTEEAEVADTFPGQVRGHTSRLSPNMPAVIVLVRSRFLVVGRSILIAETRATVNDLTD